MHGLCYFCFIDEIGLCDYCIDKNNICINCIFSDHICHNIHNDSNKNVIREWIRSNDLYYINLQEKNTNSYY